MTTFTGTTGNDILPLTGADNSGDDILYGLAGHDTLYGGAGNDLLVGGTGIDSLFGDAGLDTASYAGAAGAMTVSLTNGLAVGSDAGGAGERLYEVENLIGSAYGDRLSGSSAANSLAGGGGNDLLQGYAGNDTLQGGSGDDTLQGGTGIDTLFGDDGVDTASYAGAAGTMNISLANGLAVGSDAGGAGERLYDIENVVGSEYRDVVYGDSAANTLAGAGGNDTLRGYSGNDTLQGGNGDDTLQGGTGIDALDGGAGNDVLVGGGDGDGLLGGTGADLFAWDADSYLHWVVVADVVLDFTRGSDKIDLSALDPNTFTPGDQALTWGGVDVAPSHAGEVVFISSLNAIYVTPAGAYSGTDDDSFMIPSDVLNVNFDPLASALNPPRTGIPAVDLSDLGFAIRLDGVTTLSGSDFIL